MNSFRVCVKVFICHLCSIPGGTYQNNLFVCKRSVYYKTCISVDLDDGVYKCKCGSTSQ